MACPDRRAPENNLQRHRGLAPAMATTSEQRAAFIIITS
jgi:hypothetical protein